MTPNFIVADDEVVWRVNRKVDTGDENDFVIPLNFEFQFDWAINTESFSFVSPANVEGSQTAVLSSEVGTPVWVIEEVDPVLPPGEEGDEELSGVEGDEEEDPDNPIVVEGEEVETDLEEETEIEEEDPTDPVVVEGEETDEEETELETDDEEETDPNNLQGADERS